MEEGEVIAIRRFLLIRKLYRRHRIERAIQGWGLDRGAFYA